MHGPACEPQVAQLFCSSETFFAALLRLAVASRQAATRGQVAPGAIGGWPVAPVMLILSDISPAVLRRIPFSGTSSNAG